MLHLCLALLVFEPLTSLVAMGLLNELVLAVLGFLEYALVTEVSDEAQLMSEAETHRPGDVI
jgi:hypothetical protein